jgi:hypothetical protein
MFCLPGLLVNLAKRKYAPALLAAQPLDADLIDIKGVASVRLESRGH